MVFSTNILYLYYIITVYILGVAKMVEIIQESLDPVVLVEIAPASYVILIVPIVYSI
jgi:hypothetical protein